MNYIIVIFLIMLSWTGGILCGWIGHMFYNDFKIRR